MEIHAGRVADFRYLLNISYSPPPSASDWLLFLPLGNSFYDWITFLSLSCATLLAVSKMKLASRERKENENRAIFR